MVTTELVWVLLGVAGVAAVVDWVAVAREHKAVEYVAKPLTMAALLGMAIAIPAPDETRQLWFVAAAAFSLAGDVFLMLPRDRFVPGLASFLVAHVCYIVGLLTSGLAVPGVIAGLIVVAIGMSVVGRTVARAVRSGPDPSLLAPVVAYMAVISVMVVAALGAGPAIAAVGALLFFVSDSILAWRRFVAPLPWGGVGVMVTYHLAQACLLLSLAVA